VTGKNPLAALGEHIADPFGTTIFSKAAVVPGQAVAPPCKIPLYTDFQVRPCSSNLLMSYNGVGLRQPLLCLTISRLWDEGYCQLMMNCWLVTLTVPADAATPYPAGRERWQASNAVICCVCSSTSVAVQLAT
jgi:hypothetical protein